MVGNPYTDPYSAFPAMIETFWGHSMIPKPYYDIFSSSCWADVTADDDVQDPSAQACLAFTTNLLDFVGEYNPYALDFDTCANNALSHQRRKLLRKVLPLPRDHIKLRQLDPCEESYLSQYLNDETVKSALHVDLNISWSECSSTLNYQWDDYSTAPIYSQLLASNLNISILVYSGNDDAVCSTLGSQKWIFNLGLQTTSSSYWKVYNFESQIGGYLTQFNDDRFKFLVIRGAGHEVPTYKPAVSLDMLRRFLEWDWSLL